MNILAALFAILAVICFTSAHFAVRRKFASVPLGLTLLTLAYIAQLVWQTSHNIILH